MDKLIIGAVQYNSILILSNKELEIRNIINPGIVMAVKVDFDSRQIFKPEKFQNYLKFGYWENPTEQEKIYFVNLLKSTFSESVIHEKIINPLSFDDTYYNQ